MSYDVEVTDTYGGESNYSWVRRYIVDGNPNHLSVVRQAKKLAGWTGQRCEVSDSGDQITLRPIGRGAPCWIMFITWRDISNPYRHAPDHDEAENLAYFAAQEVRYAADPFYPRMRS